METRKARGRAGITKDTRGNWRREVAFTTSYGQLNPEAVENGLNSSGESDHAHSFDSERIGV